MCCLGPRLRVVCSGYHTQARAHTSYTLYTHTLTRVRSHRIFTPRDDRQQNADCITRSVPLVRLLNYYTVYTGRVFHLKNRTGRPLVVTKRIFYDYFFFISLNLPVHCRSPPPLPRRWQWWRLRYSHMHHIHKHDNRTHARATDDEKNIIQTEQNKTKILFLL